MSNNKFELNGRTIFIIFNTIILCFLGAICILPIIHLLAVSLSSSGPAEANEVILWPVEFTVSAYKLVLKQDVFLKAICISSERVILGILVNTTLTLLMAYPLSKSEREFRGRKFFVWSLIFIMIFDGGLVPHYILVKDLHLINNIWSFILPGAVPIFNVILVMNFMKQLPSDIEEAASIDGASYLVRLIKIILPLSKPVIATIVLFSFLGHWNAWFDGLIYSTKTDKYPLQTFMYNSIKSRDMTSLEDQLVYSEVGNLTLRSAQLFVSLIPILLSYTFLQKYFTKGLVVGAVKG